VSESFLSLSNYTGSCSQGLIDAGNTNAAGSAGDEPTGDASEAQQSAQSPCDSRVAHGLKALGSSWTGDDLGISREGNAAQETGDPVSGSNGAGDQLSKLKTAEAYQSLQALNNVLTASGADAFSTQTGDAC
jgi:hypothetical protein